MQTTFFQVFYQNVTLPLPNSFAEIKNMFNIPLTNLITI